MFNLEGDVYGCYELILALLKCKIVLTLFCSFGIVYFGTLLLAYIAMPIEF